MSHYEKLMDVTTKNEVCLLFPNSGRLSVDEITEIFSEYGNVLRVNFSGNETGMRFVRYATKEEAMKAIDGLEDHRHIQLVQPRPRPKGNYESNGQDRSRRPHERRHGQTEKIDLSKGSQSSQKSGDNQRQNNHKVKNGFGYNNSNPKNINGEASRERDLNPTGQSVSSRLNRNIQSREDSGEKREEDHLNHKHSINATKFAQLHKLRGMNANTFEPPSTRAIDAPAAENALISSALVSSSYISHGSTTGESAMDDFPPPLIAGVPFGPGPKSVEEEKVEVVVASDVVVANIHSNIGVSNIYQMLKECKPIYVSDIETVPDINVRFCYVYFESKINALKAEQKFHGFSVCGQNLIALRSIRLEAETGIY